MTYNIRYDNDNDNDNDNGSSSHAWAGRLPLMAEQLNSIHPDALGLQEALHHQMVDFGEALPGYSWVGQGRIGRIHGPFFATERLRLKQSGDFWLSDTLSVPGSTS